jgi:homoserine dehydrogenase
MNYTDFKFHDTMLEIKRQGRIHMKKIGIALFGLGTVGREVFLQLEANRRYLQEEFHIDACILAIYVKDLSKKRDIKLDGIHLTNDVQEILHNPQIQLCVECMGGVGDDITKQIVEEALKSGKHVIMSSKKTLANNLSDFLKLAQESKVQLRFDACVGGGIPICQVLLNSSSENHIKKIYGIINATTNFILTAMEEHQWSFEQALTVAKQKGYAENEWATDLDGWDAIYKMKILAGLAWKKDLVEQNLQPTSLFEQNGCSLERTGIRQLFYIEEKAGIISYYVGPFDVSKFPAFKHVSGTQNCVMVDYENSGLRSFYGNGAGGKETASVMIEDLFDLLSRKRWFVLAGQVRGERLDYEDMVEKMN